MSNAQLRTTSCPSRRALAGFPLEPEDRGECVDDTRIEVRACGDYSGTGGWVAGKKVLSTLALPALTAYAQIRVTAKRGKWNVDDPFVDPCEIRIG